MDSAGENLALVLVVFSAISALYYAGRGIWRFVRRVSHFLDDVNGETARPGVLARPGALEQIAELRVRQEEIAVRQEEIAEIAANAAQDAIAIRHELTRNGGDSTKDAAHQAARSAEAAATSAKIAADAARSTEALLQSRLDDTVEPSSV